MKFFGRSFITKHYKTVCIGRYTASKSLAATLREEPWVKNTALKTVCTIGFSPRISASEKWPRRRTNSPLNRTVFRYQSRGSHSNFAFTTMWATDNSPKIPVRQFPAKHRRTALWKSDECFILAVINYKKIGKIKKSHSVCSLRIITGLSTNLFMWCSG